MTVERAIRRSLFRHLCLIVVILRFVGLHIRFVIPGMTVPLTLCSNQPILVLFGLFPRSTRMLVRHIAFPSPGQEDFDRLRPLSYHETDAIIIAFAINHRVSLMNVSDKVSQSGLLKRDQASGG